MTGLYQDGAKWVCEMAAGGAQVLFRSVNKLLMDTATAEYLFCCDFFQEDTIFSELFTTTLAVVESSLAASIQVGTRNWCNMKKVLQIGQLCAGTCAHALGFWAYEWSPPWPPPSRWAPGTGAA